MESGPASAALVFTGIAVLLAGLWCWTLVAAKAAITWRWIPDSWAVVFANYLTSRGLSPRLPLIGWTARRPVPWAVLDLVVLTGLYIVGGAALHESGFLPTGKMETLSLDQKQVFIAANIAISIGVALASIVLTVARCGATSADLGWSVKQVWHDLRLGLIAFVMLAPPVYVIQGLLVTVWKKSEHPIIEMFKGAPDPAFFALLFVSAAVVAPLFEELVFRVLLQGFLEKLVTFRGSPVELLVGQQGNTPEVSAEVASEPQPPVAPLLVDHDIHPSLLDLSSESPDLVAELVLADQPELRTPVAWLPIAVSSAVFALLHYSHGPDWVPLLFLAAGLGYLYQRTHRLLPSLTVHALLNSLSMWGLWVQVHQPNLPSP